MKTSTQSKPVPKLSKKRERILLIDDNPVIREFLRALVRGLQHEVVGETGNGERGLDLVEQFSPSVICLDIQLPGMSGVEVLRQVKARAPNTAVMMITASPESEVVKQCINSGADSFLVKPFNPRELTDALDHALERVRGQPADSG